MRSAFGWVCALAASLCAIVAIGAVLFGGCYYQVCDCPACDGSAGDGGPDGGDGDSDCPVLPDDRPSTAPPAIIDGWEAPGNYVTLDPGEQISLTASISPTDWAPPLECVLPVSYAWDLGNWTTAQGQSAGPVSYAAPGYYRIAMTATNAIGVADLVPDALYASIWSGTVFTDNFERAALDRDTSGWSYRVSDALEMPHPPADWEIVDQGGSRRVHISWSGTTYCQPASQGLLTRLEATDAAVSVWQGRNDVASGPHYSDIIMRYRFNGRGESGPMSSYYRARVEEEIGGESSVYRFCLDAFKITGEDEVGAGLNGSQVENCGNPLERPDFTGAGFWVSAEITGTAGTVTIELSLSETQGGTPFHSFTFTDSAAPIVTPGRFGVGQCLGETYFDDFRLERRD
jgi:hypothetical protein